MQPLNSTLKKLGLTQTPPTDEEAKHFDISKIAGISQRYNGIDIFVDPYIGQDMKDSTKNRLMASDESRQLL